MRGLSCYKIQMLQPRKDSPSGVAGFCAATAMQGTTTGVDNNKQNIWRGLC